MSGKTLLITGAAGFIGRAAVAEARGQGHAVRAVLRDPASAPGSWADDPGITPVPLDLTEADAVAHLAQALSGADSLIHAAAVMTGDPVRQVADTVAMTRAVLDALAACPAPRPRLVLVSSLSVYDGRALAVGATLDETSPLEATPDTRDAYCRAKLAQEAMVREAAGAQDLEAWILRPGAVWGPGRLWNGHLGHPVGPVLIRLEAAGEVPVVHVESCATALVRAATTPPEGVEVVNVIDADRPDRAAYVAALRQGGWPRVVLPLNWRLLAGVGGVLRTVPGLKSRLPGLLSPAVLHARMKPLRFDIARLAARLGPVPDLSFAEAMARAQRDERTP